MGSVKTIRQSTTLVMCILYCVGVRMYVRIKQISLGGCNFFGPLVGVIEWHRTIECLVPVSNFAIYILPLLLSYKYDDSVMSCCDTYMLIFWLVANWCTPVYASSLLYCARVQAIII